MTMVNDQKVILLDSASKEGGWITVPFFTSELMRVMTTYLHQFGVGIQIEDFVSYNTIITNLPMIENIIVYLDDGVIRLSFLNNIPDFDFKNKFCTNALNKFIQLISEIKDEDKQLNNAYEIIFENNFHRLRRDY